MIAATSNFISIYYSLSLYKLSMIRFMHKVHFDVDFLIAHMLFSRDNLKNFETVMCLFDQFVNHVNCCYFYVVFFFLLFIMCRLAKKGPKRNKDKNAQTVKNLHEKS